MDELEKFLGGGAAVATPPKPRVPKATEEDELKKKKASSVDANKTAEADAAALMAAIARTSKGDTIAPKLSPMSGLNPNLQPASDPLDEFLSNKQITSTAPSAVATNASNAPAQVTAPPPEAQNQPKIRSILGDVLLKGLKAKQDLQQNIGQRVAGGIDTIYGVVPATVGAAVQAVTTPFVTEGPIFSIKTPSELKQGAQRAEEIGQKVAGAIDKPIGKALGITGKEAYQQPLSGVTQPTANNIKKGEKIISEIKSIVGNWEEYAEKVTVTPKLRDTITNTLNALID